MSYDLDVLIVGGGIQGLWLLKELSDLKYSSLLVTDKALGVGQTLHSQVFIHRGYLRSETRNDETESGDPWN